MNTYWKATIKEENLIDLVVYHEISHVGTETKKIVFRNDQVLWVSDTCYHGEDIYLSSHLIFQKDFETVNEQGVISIKITKEEFYKLWNKITQEYPGTKY